jgi:MOSC domain-containing protein YiiM
LANQIGDAGTRERTVSKVVGLYTCAGAGEPLVAHAEVHALKGSGIAGDRYATNQGFFSRPGEVRIRHVTLIASEAIEEANAELARRGTPTFCPHETRRNVVTAGVDVNALLGREFRVGQVRMRGTEMTNPCKRTSSLAGKAGFPEAFAGRGGVRAEILSDGIISIGDPIEQ